LDGGKAMPLSYRYYLADAKFLVALGGDEELLGQLQQVVRAPRRPLFLGRRSCPPDEPIYLGLQEEYADVRDALRRHAWIAASWYKRQSRVFDLEVCCDTEEGEIGMSQDDAPLTFSGSGRKYASRSVTRFRVPIDSLDGAQDGPESFGKKASSSYPGGHDPMGFF
jgi:CRISPR system Cascade subunit CasD